jgi:hypothetical protein
MATYSIHLRVQHGLLVHKNWIQMDKGFMQKDLQDIAEDVVKFHGHRVATGQIYNHLRYWRARWVHALNLIRLEDSRWVEKTTTIIMDVDVYFAHIKVGTIYTSFSTFIFLLHLAIFTDFNSFCKWCYIRRKLYTCETVFYT